jgi:hypothetical protein
MAGPHVVADDHLDAELSRLDVMLAVSGWRVGLTENRACDNDPDRNLARWGDTAPTPYRSG